MSQMISTPSFHTPATSDRPQDRELMIWGLIPLDIKVTTKDTAGAFFMFQHTDMSNGGPPKHVHHGQDEWFRVESGEFVFEVGDEKYHLTAGESLFAKRGIPHGWACVGDQPGTLLVMLSPAGTFETFIRQAASLSELPSVAEIAKSCAEHEMTVVGPPLPV